MPALKDELLARGASFSYFQAIRLMRREGAGPIRVRPQLTLAFPDTDIDRIESLETLDAGTQPVEQPDTRAAGGYRITANFFGLYGVSSPLPTFYTEDLLEDQREGRRARRELLDVLHAALYPLLYEAWRKYRLPLRAVEEGDAVALDTLYAFAGLGSAEQRERIPGSGGLLRYLGLFAQRHRSVLGLRTLLADAFAPASVEIESCVPQWVPLPPSQRLRLGMQAHQLGQDCPLGERIEDSDNLLRIELSELSDEMFQRLLPGGRGHVWLQFLVRFYLRRPLQVNTRLRLGRGQVQGARLGAPTWSRLGLDTWLPGSDAGRASAAAVELRLPADLPLSPRMNSHAAG